MKTTDDTFKKMEDYLLGHLSGPESRQFQEEIRVDPKLQEMYSETKQLILAVNLLEKEKIMESVKSFQKAIEEEDDEVHREAEVFPLHSSPPWHQRYRLREIVSMAASLFLIAFIWGLLSSPRTSQQLFAEQFEMASPPPKLLSDTKPGIQAYRQEKYKEAKLHFRKELMAHPQNDTSAFFLGNIYYQEEKIDSGQIQFSKVIPQENSTYLIPSKYYLALGQVYFNDLKNAKKLLIEVENSPHPLKKQAQEILQNLPTN